MLKVKKSAALEGRLNAQQDHSDNADPEEVEGDVIRGHDEPAISVADGARHHHPDQPNEEKKASQLSQQSHVVFVLVHVLHPPRGFEHEEFLLSVIVQQGHPDSSLPIPM
jgi:hypothetical protein